MNQNGQSFNQYQGQQYQNPQFQEQPKQTGQNPDDLRYSEPTFQQYCQDPIAPRSFQVFFSQVIKGRIQGFIKNLPKMLLIMIPFTVLTSLFNIFFWAVLNDTMWAGSGRLGSLSFMPYLIGGAVYSGSRYKGVTPFEIAGLTSTGKIVAPLTFALSLLISKYIIRKRQAGSGAVSRDFASAKPLKLYYEKLLGVASRPAPLNMNASGNSNMPYAQNANISNDPNNPNNPNNSLIDFGNLSNNVYMRIGLCVACILGFIIRNPFAVPLFGLIFYLSFGQGGQSDIGQTIFRIRSSDSRLHDGRKQTYPKYCEGMLVMYYMAVGLFLYSILNIVLWFLFNYNFYIRFIVSGALVAFLLVLGAGGKKRLMGMMSCFLAVLGGITMYYCRTVFGDDGGYTESGGNIGGLIRNSGFPKMFISSLLPGLSFDIGMFLFWPFQNKIQLPLVTPTETVPPVAPGYVSPQTQVSQNPYDFEGRPKEWSLNNEGDISYTDPVTGKRVNFGLTGYDENGNGIYINDRGNYYGQDELLNNYNNVTRNLEYYKDVHETAERNLAEWREKNREAEMKRAKELADRRANLDSSGDPVASDPVANDLKDKLDNFDKQNSDPPSDPDEKMIEDELKRRERFDYSNQNKPDTLERSRPEPSQPEPSRPEPSQPEPSRPEPSQPEPSRPEPSQPEPSRPEPSQPEPSRPEPSQPEPSRPEPSQPEPSQPEPSRPEPSQPEPSRPEPSQPEPSRPEPSQPEPSRPEPSQPEPSRPEPSQPEPSQPEPSRPEPSQPEPSRPEPSQPEPSRPEPREPEPYEPEPYEPEPDIPEPAKPNTDKPKVDPDEEMIEEEMRRRDRFNYGKKDTPEPSQPEPSRPEPREPEPYEPEPYEPEPDIPEPAKPNTDKPKVDPDEEMIEEEMRRRDRFNYGKKDTPKPSRPEPSQPEPSRLEPREPEPYEPKPDIPEPGTDRTSMKSDDELIREEMERRNKFDYSGSNNVEPDIPEPDIPEPDIPEPDIPEPPKTPQPNTNNVYDKDMDDMIIEELKRRNKWDFGNKNDTSF